MKRLFISLLLLWLSGPAIAAFGDRTAPTLAVEQTTGTPAIFPGPSATLPGPNAALSVAYSYDRIGRVLTAVSGQSLTYTHERAGAWSAMTYPGSLTITTCLDAAGRVSRIKEAANCANDTGLLARYAYDAASRRTQVTLGNGTGSSFAYDPQSNLATLSHDLAGTASDVSWSQSYNRVGQVTSSTLTNDGYAWTGHYNVTRSYTTNTLDQYSATTTRGLSWDGRGNLARSGPNAYTHDSENRLITARGVALTHDALGRLVRMGNAAGPHALYDGNELVAEFNASGTAIRRHVHGPGVSEPIVTYEGGAKNWLYADLQGSIVATADSTGTAANIQGYGPYGEPDADIGAGTGSDSGGRFGFTGAVRLHEATPDLHQMGERVYSASLGRFIEPDPIGTADDINLYNYAAGDPINLFDPSGMWAERNSGRIDTFQTGLDYGGFIPGLGAAPDLLNAGIYAARGQWSMAGLSAIAAVPGWGDAFKGGKKVVWNNGWRTPDGKFASPLDAGRAGGAAEAGVWDGIAAKPGWSVRTGRVAVRNGAGQLRIYDGVAISPSRRVIGLEVKSGAASRTATQRAFDQSLNQNPVNMASGVGQSVGISVRRSILVRVPRQ